MSKFDAQLGPYQAVVIDGTVRHSTILTAGLWSLYADGASCQLKTSSDGAGTPTQANPGSHYLKSGAVVWLRVEPDGSNDFVDVQRAHDETGTGTLRISKHSDKV